MPIARLRVSLFFLTSCLFAGVLSGCAGGWGDTKPLVIAPGQSLTVIQGQPATFTVTAAGTGPFAYQWFLSGSPISGATAASYTITSTTASENGDSFTVTVSNAGGSYTAGPYTLTVLVPPAITQQPLNQTVTAGQQATFTVSIVSTATTPLSYQWVKSGAAITGATAASFTTAATSTSDSGSTYTVTISNAAGSVTSSAAILTVNPIAPTLAFAAIPVQTYGDAPFTVSASSQSSGAITYSIVSGPATINGNTVTITGAGAVVIEASQAASGNYAAATVTTSFTVASEVPTLTFATIPPTDYVDGNPPFTVSASSQSSGAVTYSIVSGPATINGGSVTVTGAGLVVIQASQAASGNYAAATATTSFTAVYSIPVATSLVGSTASPAFGASINLVPTFSGGTAKIGSLGSGSSDITSSAVSGSSYATPAITSAKTYTLTVTSSGGSTATATFTASPTPVIITPVSPANQNAGPGIMDFTAAASGGATNLLVWSASGGSITSLGAWTSPNTAGAYTITATSVDDPAVSASTTATVSAPVITAQPVGKNACVGYSASLNVAANYATSYEWFNGSNAVGSSPALTFANLTTQDSGSYQAVVSNGAGNVNSNTAILNVVQPTTLTVTQNPQPVSVYATQTATFSVSATGTGTLNYQWYTGTPGSGTAISGANSNNYTTGALAASDNGNQYYATVTDSDCTDTTLTSSAATLTVSSTDTAVPPTIVIQPVGTTASVGGTATFSVTASGPGTLTYQWYRVPYQPTGMSSTAGIAISGATSATYTVPTGETAQSNDGDNYFVVVTNQYGTAVSNHVMLAVGAGIVMQITNQPQTEYISATTLASFSTAATCTGCIPAYQWYWYAPGASSPTTLTDGSVSSGALSGATVVGSATSSLNIEDVPATATGGVFYVTVTSTSDGSTQITGTNPLTSNNAGLFVGALGSVGNATAGDGLCNTGTTNWVLNGTNPGVSPGDVPFQNIAQCTIELTNDGGGQHAAVYWPTLISTANFTVSFTVTISATSTPADGFTMVLADPTQGATTSSIGTSGEGLGANGIPGLVVGFDTYQNGNLSINLNCTFTHESGDPDDACDPTTVPYMAVGPGAELLWENPWYFVNGNLDTQNSTDYPISTYANSTHNYVVSVVDGVMTVTMDGYELFTGQVSLPPAAYLGFTASTGGSEEAVTLSNLTATVSAP